MPSDSNGNYTLPAGYLAETGETILASQHNPPLEDLAAAQSARLMRAGAAPMTGQLKVIGGTVGAPGLAFSTALSTGIYKTTDGWGVSINGALVAEFGAAGLVSGIATAAIADNSITYPKIQKPTGVSKLLGSPSVAALAITGAANNGSGLIRLTVSSTTDLVTSQTKVVSGVVGTTEANASWTITVVSGTTVDLQGSTFANAYVSGGFLGGSVEEITMGSGVHIVGNALRSAFAPPSSFKNLSIKVATNTTVAVLADFVAVTDGTTYQTLAVGGTINLGTTGINALDTGTIAAATWYAIWAISKPDGTNALLASTSATAPTLPAGYTSKARIGWVRTAAGSAQLMGTWQLGRRAQYVVGLAQTANAPIMISGASGSISVPTWTAVAVANHVPTTASRISLSLQVATDTSGAMAAPNGSYGNFLSLTNPPPLRTQITGGNSVYVTSSADWMLESSSVYYASAIAGPTLACLGWEDNI